MTTSRLSISESSLSHPTDPTSSATAVVFRGDGEPKSPDLLLSGLARANSGIGLETDSYSLGGSVKQLEDHFAQLLGKEAAIFMPTGTLANHLAIRALCGVQPRAIVQEQSHLYHDSGDCVTQLSGINLIPLAHGKPSFTLEEVQHTVTESGAGRVDRPVGALMIESPVRRQMGQVTPYDDMQDITAFCRSQGIGTHLDGARIYMMSAATGISPAQYAALFDSVYVSLYKYFGAPFGAILAGAAPIIEGMYHTRRMFGGGLASSYFAAALTLQGLEGFEVRFQEAMDQAKILLHQLSELPGLQVSEFKHGSNIFPMRLDDSVDSNRFIELLRTSDIFVYPEEGSSTLSSLTVNTTILRQSADTILSAFRDALSACYGLIPTI